MDARRPSPPSPAVVGRPRRRGAPRDGKVPHRSRTSRRNGNQAHHTSKTTSSSSSHEDRTVPSSTAPEVAPPAQQQQYEVKVLARTKKQGQEYMLVEWVGLDYEPEWVLASNVKEIEVESEAKEDEIVTQERKEHQKDDQDNGAECKDQVSVQNTKKTTQSINPERAKESEEKVEEEEEEEEDEADDGADFDYNQEDESVSGDEDFIPPGSGRKRRRSQSGRERRKRSRVSKADNAEYDDDEDEEEEEERAGSKKRAWTPEEDEVLLEAAKQHAKKGFVSWVRVARQVGQNRTPKGCKRRFEQMENVIRVYDTVEKRLERENMVNNSRQRPWTKEEIERLWRVAQEKDLKFDSPEWVDIEMDFKRSNRALQLKFADLKKKRRPSSYHQNV